MSFSAKILKDNGGGGDGGEMWKEVWEIPRYS